MKIAGLDEVGRGPLAGPLVACGLILNKQNPITKLKDSKKLNHKQREELRKIIIKSGAEVVIEEISVNLINKRGIGWANKEIFKRIIKKLEADKYILDGNLKIKMKGKNIKSVIKADNSRKCVMAAAIIAKEYRDKLMSDLDTKFPKYGWKMNKGYGTKFHIEALREHGVTMHHRTLFVKTALKNLCSFSDASLQHFS